MNVLRAVFTGLLLTLPVAAAAQDVKIDFDKAFDFSTVKTYSMKLGTSWGNDLSERRVLAEFDEAIAAKGWKKVDEAQANMHVVIHGASTTKRTASTFYSGGMGGYGYRYGGMGSMGTSSTVVNEYQVGTVVVDMFEPNSKSLVFRGVAEGEISDNAERNAKRLDKASTKMFKDFPPVPKKK